MSNQEPERIVDGTGTSETARYVIFIGLVGIFLGTQWCAMRYLTGLTRIAAIVGAALVFSIIGIRVHPNPKGD